MLFGLFGKKKIEAVEEEDNSEKCPRIWKFPRDKAQALIIVQNEFAKDIWNDLKRFNYYSALADAGFDGFGHGKWFYRFGAHNKYGTDFAGDIGFPCPYLEEILDEEA